MTDDDDFGGRRTFVPSIPPGADPSRFRLDPTTRRLLQLADGVRDDEALAAALGQSVEAVRSTLEMLKRAGLVALALADAPRWVPEITPLGDEVGHDAPTQPPPAQVPAQAPPQAPTVAAVDVTEAWRGSSAVSLANKPVKALLEDLEKSRFAGAVRFERGGDRIELYFEGGQPIGVRSECARHDLGETLQKGGKITLQRLEGYKAAMAEGGVNPVAALRRAGMSDRAELGRALSWHGGQILAEVSRWPDGGARIAVWVPVPQGIAKVRIQADVHTGKSDWRDGPLSPDEDEFIERNLSRYLVVNPAAAKVLGTMKLGEKEARFVRHVAAEPKQLREALSISTLFRSLTRKLLFALIHAGLFELQETNPDGGSEIPLEELANYYGLLSLENHYNVLAAHPSSTEREIGERYAVRRAQFEDARFTNAEPEHLEIPLRKIRDRLHEAFTCLSTAQSRREYRERIYEKEQLDTFFELQLRKAEVVLKLRCDAKAALEVVESALELKPNEPEASILAATALARLGRRSDAQRVVAGIRAVPGRLKAEMEDLNRELGRPPPR